MRSSLLSRERLRFSLKPTIDGRSVVLEVQDTGVGVPPSELSRLFERFYRVEGQRSRSFEGSGIGLALVNELVKLHGGAITVESEVDRGTTFKVTIPFGTSHLPKEKIGAGQYSHSSFNAQPKFRRRGIGVVA